MKNCLIVLAILLVCFVIAVFLVLSPLGGSGTGRPSGEDYMIATWRDYDDRGLRGLEVSVGTDRIIVDVPATPVFKQIIEKGHWNLHSFYCDSHVDEPSEVIVARELKNEDLEVDIGRFLPDHPGKIVCVKVERTIDEERPPYPVIIPGQTVSYPPPKGLIRVGMLEWDLDTLPWHADKIEFTPSVVTVDTTTLSDGKRNQNYFPTREDRDDNDESPKVYTFHSDRSDAPQLLVTVYHGRVIQVTGGAEETADIPYRLPPPTSDKAQEPDKETDWENWLFDLLFKR